MIKKRKRIGKITQILSTVLAVIILATAVFTSGVLATEILKEGNSENIFDIEVRHNGYLVALTNKPFFENNVLYMPLRELFEKTGLVDNEDSYIKWDNGKIILCLTEGDNVPEYDKFGNVSGNKPIKIQYYYGIEIGKAEYILNPGGTLPEHRQHLSQRKDMTNAPILKDNVTYIPYEYVEYMVNKVMQNHEITIWDITNLSTKNIDNIDNAENMTYEDIRSLQISVDNGHFPWRLDPEQVIMAFLSSKGISISNIRLPEITNDTLKYVDDNIEMELFKPIDKTEKGIWIVKTFQKKGNAIIQEVHFYERTPAQAWISKQEDGWYKVPQKISAVFQYEGDTPSSVMAYYTSTGTEMDNEKRLIGKTDSFIYQTKANVISMDIDFSKEDTLGHLWFVFKFEDGSSVVSEIYNMYIE